MIDIRVAGGQSLSVNALGTKTGNILDRSVVSQREHKNKTLQFTFTLKITQQTISSNLTFITQYTERQLCDCNE